MEVRKLINTTDSAGQARVEERVLDVHPEHTVNTSRLTEVDLEYVDEEPEVAYVVTGTGWVATFEDGSTRPLVLWCVRDDASAYGVVVDRDGTIDASKDVGAEDGFCTYDYTGG